jgi:type IX secretion system PorP/SprF family membrane protein
MKLRIFTILIILFQWLSSEGQDIHFSQFYQSPFSLNPALTGEFSGALRVIGNQRTQWRSVTTPFATVGIAADGKLDKYPGVAAGVSFFNDRAGDSQLTTNLIHFSAAKKWSVIPDKKGNLSVGLMLGLTTMSIDYGALNFDNQWTGLFYDPSIAPGENFARDSRAYMNFHTGAFYSQEEAKGFWGAGFSIFNITSPDQSWFDQAFVRLSPRFNFHGFYNYKINETWRAEPMLLLMTQSPHRELTIGARGHYIVSDKDWMYRSFYGGAFARTRDAGYLVAGVRYDNWDVGLSYDFNLSTLRTASNSRGGFEIGVIYILQPPARIGEIKKVCPDYI